MMKIEKLDFYYRKEKPILQGVSTHLDAGKIYGLLGLNGEGKTTLLKLIAGLIFPKRGRIEFEEKFLSTNRSKALFEYIYMLPDQPQSTSISIFDFAKIYSVFYKNFSTDFFEEALHEFHLKPQHKIKALSLGQQKKFHLAFALAANTKYLLLDEPTNGLDIPSKSIFRMLLAKAIDEEKIIVISTHMVNDVAKLLDHLLIIKNGKLALDSSISTLQEKYAFEYSTRPTENILYEEKSIDSYKTIRYNIDHIETSINIELLFNAIQNNKL